MKTVAMMRDFSYRAKRTVFVQYLGGMTYTRVPEAAVRAIVAARAGKVVEPEDLNVGS
jgi:hypothetical protein